MNEVELGVQERQIIREDILNKQSEILKKQRKKLTARDFEPIKIIGRGAFGEVRLCRTNKNEYVAVKKLKRKDMVNKNQVKHIMMEKEILSVLKNEWVPELRYAFKDSKHLYLVMDYMPGGDLMNLFIEKDIIAEQDAKLYLAELVLAIESVHKANYIHRDLKPDNILIDQDGHIKLSDFGLCAKFDIKERINAFTSKNRDKTSSSKKTRREKRKLLHSTVGTPDYIAPEIFQQIGYNEIVDWWSLGIIFYEMIIGYPPFFSDDSSKTYKKILEWEKHFSIPDDAGISEEASDLICKLIADKRIRLGVNGAAEIKAHPFFQGIDWKNIKKTKPFFIPEVS